MQKYLSFLSLFICILFFSQPPLQVKVKDASGNENLHVTCSNDLDANGCLALQLEYPVLKGTSTYAITSEVYTPPIPLNQGTSLNANFDDLFAAKLDLPFSFCFFNQNFNALVVGSNGMVTFNVSQLGNINYPNVIWQNPDPGLPKNSIFGAYHDMVFAAGDPSEIYYATIGTAPYRKFVINFYNGRVAGCTDRSSSQIVLHETTNIVEVFIDKKLTPCPTRKFENALIGIMNNDGTLGYSPVARNTGNWQALQEAYKFTPSGNTVQPEVIWTNSAGQTVGNGVQATVCPTVNDTYTATVKYNVCGNAFLTFTDDFVLDFDASYPAAKNYTESYCGNTPININLNSFKPNLTSQNPANFNFSFHATLQDAQAGQNSLSTSYSLNSDAVFYVRIQNPNDASCFRIAVLTLNFLSKNLVKNSVEICDTNNDAIENGYDLTLLNDQILPPGTTGISYFLTQANAQNNANAVLTADITTSTQIWVRVQDANCVYVLGPVNFLFKAGVNANLAITYQYSMCDINADNAEAFDFTVNLGPLISTQTGAVFSVYNTYAEAFSGAGPGVGTIKNGIYQIFVRVEIPGGCFAIVEVDMNVTLTEIKANAKDEYICFNGTEDVSFNLQTLSMGMLVAPATVPFTEYYASYADASFKTNPIAPNQTITTNGNFVTKTYFVRFEQSEICYTIRPINVHLVHPVVETANFSICDFNNDNTESVSLLSYSSQILGGQNATVLYYLTQADAQSGNNPVTSATITGNTQIFVKITSFNCSKVYPVTFSLVSTPAVNSVVNISLNNICDNNNDGIEDYNLTLAQPQIYSVSSGVNFTYYSSYNALTHVFTGEISNPTQFSIQGNATVFVKVKFNNSACFSVAQLNVQMIFLPAVVLTNAVINTCDEDFNLSETFQLNDAVSQLFVSSQNTYSLSDMNITYYLTSAEANAGNTASQLGNTYTTSLSTLQVWARFQSKTTGCYSVAPIQLNTYFPPKAINATVTVCDDNLDGSYEVNLLNFVQLYVDIQNPLNTFSFFLTQQDAQNGVNEIQNPQNFVAQPFPAQIWVKIQNIPACYDIASITFIFGNKVVLENQGPFLLNACDTGNDGSDQVDLTQFQQQIYSGANATFTYYSSLSDVNAGTNSIANPTNYLYSQNTGPHKIYLKISVPGSCPQMVIINLSLKPTPYFDIPTLYICPEASLDYTVMVEGFQITSYVWTNASGQVVSTSATATGLTVGSYTLTVTASNGCTYTDTFEVEYYDVPVITQMAATGNTYTVTATGSQPMVYSTDGSSWQSSNVFHNLPTGITTFYVKYVEGKCIVKQDGLVLDIKNAITPNGDGYNDRWIVKDLYFFGNKTTNVKVFDRYQHLVFEQNTNSQIIWDGTIGKRPLPTSTYWYVITVPDGRVFTGWILVKNTD